MNTPAERTPRPNAKIKIINAAVTVAVRKGLRRFSRVEVAQEAEVAEATVSYHFGNMDELRREIVKTAIEREFVSILADARADRDSAELFRAMPAALKQKVAAYIAR